MNYPGAESRDALQIKYVNMENKVSGYSSILMNHKGINLSVRQRRINFLIYVFSVFVVLAPVVFLINDLIKECVEKGGRVVKSWTPTCSYNGRDYHSPRISLLYPTGGEILKKGSTYTIRWVISNGNGEKIPDLVYLLLFGKYQEKGCEQSEGSTVVVCPQDIYTVAENVPNSGEFIWIVNKDIKPGKYSLEIFGKLDKDKGLGDSSDFFDVVD